MTMTTLGIIGDRSFADLSRIFDVLDQYEDVERIAIADHIGLSACAIGWAKAHDIPALVLPDRGNIFDHIDTLIYFADVPVPESVKGLLKEACDDYKVKLRLVTV